MKTAAFQELHTDRLHLRKLCREDAAQFFRFAGSEAVTKYMFWKPHRDICESVSSIEKTLRRYEEGNCWRWGIALQGTEELIGIIDLLKVDAAEDSCTFAYMLAEEHWGRGYGTEALTAVLWFAFEELELEAVWSEHFAGNEASGAVMRKAGMTFCGTEPQKHEKCGVIYDAPQYRITRQEWKNRIS